MLLDTTRMCRVNTFALYPITSANVCVGFLVQWWLSHKLHCDSCWPTPITLITSAGICDQRAKISWGLKPMISTESLHRQSDTPFSYRFYLYGFIWSSIHFSSHIG